MSIWYYFLVVIGSIIGGAIIGFMIFFMITYVSDFILKRKQKKQSPLQMAKPNRINIMEKEVLENERIRRDDDEFREYEKLRAITKGERGIKPNINQPTSNRGISERGEISSKFNFSNESKKSITRTNNFEFKKD